MRSFTSGWLTSVRECCGAQEGMGDMSGKTQKIKGSNIREEEPGESGFEPWSNFFLAGWLWTSDLSDQLWPPHPFNAHCNACVVELWWGSDWHRMPTTSTTIALMSLTTSFSLGPVLAGSKSVSAARLPQVHSMPVNLSLLQKLFFEREWAWSPLLPGLLTCHGVLHAWPGPHSFLSNRGVMGRKGKWEWPRQCTPGLHQWPRCGEGPPGWPGTWGSGAVCQSSPHWALVCFTDFCLCDLCL